MNEKALSDDGNTAYKMIDCINFAKLSLYSVNTAPVCKICRSYCKEGKKTKTKWCWNIYIGSVFTVHDEAVNMSDSVFLWQIK